ncbi:DegV family protein [Streptococcus halichoeri]|uniref:DegV family protein n=1 Tax=Streptococcus halichoeri TaxID=254785 RepID=UPI0013580C05|nr:DegV family protein [Streptococcus halichoeri]
MNLAVITDNTAALPDCIQGHPDLFVIDFPIMMNGQTYYEGHNLERDDFYQAMANSSELPKTSQPALTELDDLLHQLEDKGYTHVIGLFLAGGISGFWQNIQFLVEEHPQLTIAFPDSKIASVPVGLMIRNVLNWAQNDLHFTQIVTLLQDQIERTTAFIVVDDLNHLVKGGRLSNGSALLGSLLSIKPILYFDDEGKIVVYEKVRTEKKALKRIVELVKAFAQTGDYEFSIIGANADEKVAALHHLLLENGFADQFELVQFSAVVGVHLGPGAIGIGVTPKMPMSFTNC